MKQQQQQQKKKKKIERIKKIYKEITGRSRFLWAN